jgi:hypothetical protein
VDKEKYKKAEKDIEGKLPPVNELEMRAILAHVKLCLICQNIAREHERF